MQRLQTVYGPIRAVLLTIAAIRRHPGSLDDDQILGEGHVCHVPCLGTSLELLQDILSTWVSVDVLIGFEDR